MRVTTTVTRLCATLQLVCFEHRTSGLWPLCDNSEAKRELVCQQTVGMINRTGIRSGKLDCVAVHIIISPLPTS